MAGFKALMEKGDGVLTKVNGVWTYPGCATDPSGTNLVLPLEFVSDADVQKALSDGDLRAAVVSPTGVVSSVRATKDGTTVVHGGAAGTAELGTELPKGSRPEHDAGRKPMTAADVEKIVTATAEALHPHPAPAPAKSAAPVPGVHKR